VSALGVRLSVLAGKTIPLPLPEPVISRLRSVKVTETDTQRSAFTLVLDAGRSGPLAALDVPLMSSGGIGPGMRIVVSVWFGAWPTVLSDGIVSDVQLSPGASPGAATLTVTGDDISGLLDRHSVSRQHLTPTDYVTVLTVLAPYAANGILPNVIPPLDMDVRLPIDGATAQQSTDLEFLSTLAERHGYVAYTTPGPLPGMSTFYWGPPIRIGLPQRALSIDLGAETNVLSPPTFRADALAPVTSEGSVQDPRSGSAIPVRSPMSMRVPLAAMPLRLINGSDTRSRTARESGPSATTAAARAQAAVDQSDDAAVTGEGVLDAARYGGILRPRGLVGLRGAGWSHDGLWYVRKVEHDIAPGGYQQKFTISREGYGSTVPVVLT
jgi:hypothetical protein